MATVNEIIKQGVLLLLIAAENHGKECNNYKCCILRINIGN